MGKSRKIEITDEMRTAVLAEMCDREGHFIGFNEALGPDEKDHTTVKNRDPDKLPHFYCTRCGLTWIVVEQAAANYDDADTKFRGRLKDDDPQKTRKSKK